MTALPETNVAAGRLDDELVREALLSAERVGPVRWARDERPPREGYALRAEPAAEDEAAGDCSADADAVAG